MWPSTALPQNTELLFDIGTITTDLKCTIGTLHMAASYWRLRGTTV